MKTKTLAVALFAAVMTVTIGVQPVFAATATGSATVEPKTCGLDIVGSTIVNYPNLIDGQFGAGITGLSLNNTGNSDGTILLSGTNWYNATNSTQTVMNANQTHYSVLNIGTEVQYLSAPDLNTTPESFSLLPPNTPVNLFFGLLVNLIDPLFTGAIEQTMTLTTECV